MTNKSFATVEQHICPICGSSHDTGAILMDRRLSNKFESHTVTGHSLCPKHKKLFDEGYVAAVEVDETKSIFNNGRITPKGACCTGRCLHIHRRAWNQIFNTDLPEGTPFVYIQDEAFNKVAALIA